MAECVRCGAPTDAYACRQDAQALADALRVAAGHAEDAEAVLARQTRYGTAAGGGNGTPLPVDLTAAERYGAVENTIGTWARHVVDERGTELPARRPKLGPTCAVIGCGHGSCLGIQIRRPPRTLAAAAGWLATQVDWLRLRPEAGEAFDELHDACTQLARLVDRPADKELVGVCDCGRVLYAARGRTVIQCPNPCGATWNVAESRDILRKHLGDKLVTAAEAARLSAYIDTDRSQGQIRKLINKWAERGELAVHRLRDEPAYRFGEVAARLAATPRRERRTGEAAEMGA